ncbi:MAG: carboxypeptidase-like regulatory domain-containing protein [Armatimonadota bacterium]|nr:carboxypeptidase-like regulatory domain-containing protein [Armatimonadota bacterium]
MRRTLARRDRAGLARAPGLLVGITVLAAMSAGVTAATPGGPAGPVPGGAPGSGVIRGTVRNATTGAPVAGSPIQLVFIAGQSAEPAGTARSDAAGRFEFRQLPDGRYLITARHQGVSYATHAVLSGGAAEVTVRVYDASTLVPLRVSLLGMAVDVQRGFVRVNEVLHLQNPTTRTFLGDVTVALPDGARFIVYNDGFHQPRASGAAITDRLIVRPGGHQLAYTYSVRGDGDVSLNRRLSWPVDRLELFVAAPAEARSPRLQALPSVVGDDGRTFTRASGRAVPPGELTMVIAGVPPTRLWVAPAAAGLLAALLIAGLMVAISRTLA